MILDELFDRLFLRAPQRVQAQETLGMRFDQPITEEQAPAICELIGRDYAHLVREERERAEAARVKQELRERLAREAEERRERFRQARAEKAEQRRNSLLNEIEQARATAIAKAKDWGPIATWARDRGIRLYHFTDARNLQSIHEHGLLSWIHLEAHGLLDQVHPASTGDSRATDQMMGLGKYVRLCFVSAHPMAYVAEQQGRVVDPQYLQVDLRTLDLPGVRFADCNALDNDVNLTPPGLPEAVARFFFMYRIDWDLIVDDEHFRTHAPWWDPKKGRWQAEALVPVIVPRELLLF